ncbi:MAG: hypothetical protein IKY23_04150 [Lachnospiraceae bacterium]|nr:hypothetical protein [Lachnospiraceae bacterium]
MTERSMTKKWMKRLFSICLALVVLFTAMMSNVCTLQVDAKAPTKGSGFSGKSYQEWCQKMSVYSQMQKSGCRITAYAKMLSEAGYTQVGNPDKFYEWGIKKKYYTKKSVNENATFGTPAITYVKEQGGQAQLVKKISISGMKKSKVASTIMGYINDGYYCILSCGAHTSYVGREASLAAKTPVLLDSSFSTKNSKWSGTYSNIIKYTDYTSNSFTNLRIFKISKGGNAGGQQPVVSTSKPEVNLTAYPVNLLKGSSFGLRGTIKAKGIITSVTGTIYDSKGKKVVSASDKPYAESFDIKNGNVNKKLSFGSLANGSYTLKIAATNASGTTTVTKSFVVASKPKISITTAPSSIKKGKSFGLRGTITSADNAKITSVKSYIVNSKGKTVQSASDTISTKSFSVKSGNINQKLYFGKLGKGKYTLKITATNAVGTTTYKKEFTVK